MRQCRDLALDSWVERSPWWTSWLTLWVRGPWGYTETLSTISCPQVAVISMLWVATAEEQHVRAFTLFPAFMTMAIILLHMFWGVVFFDACEKQRWWAVAAVVVSHLTVSCLVSWFKGFFNIPRQTSKCHCSSESRRVLSPGQMSSCYWLNWLNCKVYLFI